MRLKRPEIKLALELIRQTADQEDCVIIDQSLELIVRMMRVLENIISETLFPGLSRSSSYSVDERVVESEDMKKYWQINNQVSSFIKDCYLSDNNPFVLERPKKTTCFLSLFNPCSYMKPDKFDIEKVSENEVLQLKYTKLLSEMKRITSNHENAIKSPLHGC